MQLYQTRVSENFRLPQGFADRFPWLIKDRQGFSYIHDQQRISAFVSWLHALDKRGLIGQPRDRAISHADSYLLSIEPSPRWVTNEDEKDAMPSDKQSSCDRGGRSTSQSVVTQHRNRTC